MQHFDGYIRVSDVKGRNGDRFLSPEIQADTIKRIAREKGLELNEPIVRELDVSGGKRIEDRELGRLVERVERGESAGIIVWKLSRFSRNLQDCVNVTTRIKDAGGRLIADDFDTANTGMANATLGFLAGLAQDEREARREGFEQARSRSIDNGIYNGRAPYGYVKGKDGRLKIASSAKANIVRKVFEQRAAGVPFSQIARERGWAHSTTRQILVNEAYIGVAYSGDYRKENAHPAIISPELWAAAQAGRVRQGAPPGETTKDRLLLGIARCAGCGHSLKVVRRRRADGSFLPAYFCKDAAAQRCPDRAYVHAEVLDEYVAAWFADALTSAPRMIDVVSAGRELEQGQAEQAEAEAQLVAYVESADTLDRALFQRGLSARQRRVDEARERVHDLSARLIRIPVGGPLIDLWRDFDPLERREVLAGFLDRVEVARGASRDLRGHVRIVWTDGTVADNEGGIRVAAA